MKSRFLALVLVSCLASTVSLFGQENSKRPMEFMDIMGMRSASAPDFSHDGQWAVYTISHINWKKNKNFTDLWLTSTETGEARQLTFTDDKNERSPEWSPQGGFFAFLSDREGKKNQLYFMRPTGGEAWKVTNQKDGVGSFRFSEDGNFLVFTAGKPEKRQLWLVDLTDGPDNAKPEKFTKHKTPVQAFWWSPGSKEIYFTAPDRVDKNDQKRKKKGFDVNIADQQQSPRHLWVIGVEGKEEQRLTEDDYTVSGVVISKDGRWVTFRGGTTDRHAGRFGSFFDSELYRLDRQSGQIARLTNNDVPEGGAVFSRDSKWLAFTAPANFEKSRQSEIFVMAAGGAPGSWKMLTGGFDRTVGGFGGGLFWSLDSSRIYFNVNQGVKRNLFYVPRQGGKVTQLTHHDASVNISFNRDAGRLLIRHSDPHSPSDYYISHLNQLDDSNQWVRVTNANPQVKEFQLANYETVTWKSSDGTEVEGILIYPIGYEKGKRYPLIVQIHGGPAGSYTRSFSGTYRNYTHIYAANGYALFQPNYRGSAGYGEKFRMEIAGDYFRQAFDDIELGVDRLIERGIVDPDKMGYMGWSAGGHWSNWTLVSTDRYKAISTGAGAVNWISLYAQTDVQPPREFYFKGRPYDNWDHYVEVSPLKYINNATTPTLIHFGEKDERIPMPQGKELHMALKKLGVPTEFIIYPGQPHGLRNRRYQMVKMQAEFYWMEKWIKGREGWIDWKQMLATLGDDEEKKGPGETDFSGIDQHLNNLMKEQQLVSLGAGIVKDGEIVYLKGFGWEDREAKILVRPRKTLFRWASISKTLTAIVAEKLALEGKLDLDRPITDYYPGFPAPKTYLERCKNNGEKKRVGGESYTCANGFYEFPLARKDRIITTRMLLGHLGGIMHYTNGRGSPVPPQELTNDPKHGADFSWALDYLKDKPLVAKPGARMSYTTFGFNLLGAVLEAAAKKPFADLVAEHIAGPMEMTTIRPDYEWKKYPNRAAGYQPERRRARSSNGNGNRSATPRKIIRQGSNDVSWKLPGGGFISTVEDLANYCGGLMGEKVLSKAAKKDMWTPQKTTAGEEINTGLAFRIGAHDGHRHISHGGSQEKTRTMLTLSPDDNVCVVVMSNTAHANPRRIAQQIEELYRKQM